MHLSKLHYHHYQQYGIDGIDGIDGIPVRGSKGRNHACNKGWKSGLAFSVHQYICRSTSVDRKGGKETNKDTKRLKEITHQQWLTELVD